MPARSRSASTAKPMAVALGVALPLCMSLYTQQQDRLAEQRQRQQAELTRSQAAAERDRSTAAALNSQLRQARAGAAADPAGYCAELGQEAQLAATGTYGAFATGVLVTRFVSGASGDAGLPDACLCREQAQGLYAALQPRASRLARSLARRDLVPLQRELGDALDECVDDAAKATAGAASVPPPRLGAATAADSDSETSAAGAGLLAQAALPALRPRLYIQLPEAAGDSLNCLRDALREQGVIVPDFDIVGRRAPAATQLRYVAAEARPQAEQLLQTLRSLQPRCGGAGSQLAAAALPDAPADYSRLRGNAGPNHFELWLGAAPAPARPGS